MMPPAPLDPRVLEQAADWLVLLHGGDASDRDRSACEQWRLSCPEHARAWSRAERLMAQFDSVPAALAMPALDRPQRGGNAGAGGRRSAVVRIAALLAAVPAAWLSWKLADRAGWSADYRCDTGQQRQLTLADGTQITMNTASALDMRFDSTQRLLMVRAGEVLVHTGADRGHDAGNDRRNDRGNGHGNDRGNGTGHRPLRVTTAQGRMEALGTRFSVRQQHGRTRLVVLDGAVRIEPGRGDAVASQVLRAGWLTSFTDSDIAPASVADDSSIAWTHGMLLADQMPLADFASELERYRSGIVRVDAGVAGLRVSGAFPIADRARTLAMLVATYPLAAHDRWDGYWLTLAAR